jgi:transposase
VRGLSVREQKGLHTMQIQSILRRVHPIRGFVYGKAKLKIGKRACRIEVQIRPRRGSKAVCGGCGRKRGTYDSLDERHFEFVPLWGIAVVLLYALRRVNCSHCGVLAEMVPWASGKSPLTYAYSWFLADWAKVLSWKETARRFKTTWHTVFRSVEHAVQWGLAHRSLDGIRSIGVDELAWKKGHKYLTLVYQLDHGSRRLLHVCRDRTAASFNSFFDMLGPERVQSIEFVVSDMWRAFLKVVRTRCNQALHVLDRFHVMQLLSKVIDQTRRDEVRQLRTQGKQPVLTKTRWVLLKRKGNLTGKQRTKLRELLQWNLRTVRAYLLKEEFQHFWTYKAPWAARRFLKAWTTAALRTRNKHLRKLARTLRDHETELLNWIRARHKLAMGATEGFNNKARITTRKAYGFRTYEHAEIALYHSLGNLPEPDWLTHRFV